MHLWCMKMKEVNGDKEQATQRQYHLKGVKLSKQNKNCV